MGFLLTDTSINLTNAHKQVIANLVDQNPNASLQEIAAKLSDMPEMMTCHCPITPALLEELGHTPPTAPHCEAVEQKEETGRHKTLSVEVLRKQLEVRHDRIQERIESLLDEDLVSAGQLKTVELLAKIDDNICNKLMDLMAGESTPTLPQAILIACLRRHGVAESEIQIIEDFRVA